MFRVVSVRVMRVFFFKKLTGLAESTWMFSCTKLSFPITIFSNLFTSFQSLSKSSVKFNTKNALPSLCPVTDHALVTPQHALFTWLYTAG